VAIGKEYDQNYLFLMLLKFYHHLHPFSRLKVFFLKIDETKSLDIFEMMANTNKLAKEFVNQELLIFCRY
jgi:phage anti-repressor protein